MAFLIGGANSAAADTGLTNSLRSNQPDGAYLSFALSSPNTDIFTMSVWVKSSLLLTGSGVFAEISKALTGEAGEYTAFAGHFDGYTDHGGRSSFNAYDGVNNGYSIRWGAPGTFKHRDPSAWYHIVMRMDSSQGVLASRARFYFNGEDISSKLTKTVDPDQNDDYFHGTGSSVFFPGGANTGGKWNGYIAECAYIDGTSYAASTFGETDDDSGIWKPKEFKDDVTFGTNGVYLEFKESGTGTNSSGLGADTSGNDNHMAVTNFTSTDQCTDTPANNFCTLNPLDVGSDLRDNGSFAEGNCYLTNGDTSGQGNQQRVRGTIAMANGKWYYEMQLKGNSAAIGALDIDVAHGTTTGNSMMIQYLQQGEFVYYNGSGAVTVTSGIDTYTDDDTVGFALDMDNLKAYCHKNGTWQNSGDPTSGATGTGAVPIVSGTELSPLALDDSSGSAGTSSWNFGNPPHSISSGNADANGYGNFEYAPPSGYYALCTKNLAEFG